MGKITHIDLVNSNKEYKLRVKKLKEEFTEIFKSNIHRDGSDKLFNWIENSSDFFYAPASSRYHLAQPGGLCEHSINVYHRFVDEYMAEKTKYGRVEYVLSDVEKETLAICALLHDICKTDFYCIEMRNRKNDAGKWESYPFYSFDNKLPYGHGEKSVYMISGFMKLSREEAMAIRWHMGSFDDSVKGGSSDQSVAFNMFELAPILHIADLKATFLDEKEISNEN